MFLSTFRSQRLSWEYERSSVSPVERAGNCPRPSFAISFVLQPSPATGHLLERGAPSAPAPPFFSITISVLD
jgi:hypothetical protein